MSISDSAAWRQVGPGHAALSPPAGSSKARWRSRARLAIERQESPSGRNAQVKLTTTSVVSRFASLRV